MNDITIYSTVLQYNIFYYYNTYSYLLTKLPFLLLLLLTTSSTTTTHYLSHPSLSSPMPDKTKRASHSCSWSSSDTTPSSSTSATQSSPSDSLADSASWTRPSAMDGWILIIWRKYAVDGCGLYCLQYDNTILYVVILYTMYCHYYINTILYTKYCLLTLYHTFITTQYILYAALRTPSRRTTTWPTCSRALRWPICAGSYS